MVQTRAYSGLSDQSSSLRIRRLWIEGQTIEAEREGRALIARFQAAGEGRSLEAARTQEWLARALVSQNRLAGAVQFAETALKLKRSLLPAGDPEFVSTLVIRGQLYSWQDQSDEANDLLGEALRIAVAHRPDFHLSEIYSLLGQQAQKKGYSSQDPQERRAWFRRASEQFEESLRICRLVEDVPPWAPATLADTLATLMGQLERPKEAEEYVRLALEWSAGLTPHNLGDSFLSWRLAAREPDLARARDRMVAALPAVTAFDPRLALYGLRDLIQRMNDLSVQTELLEHAESILGGLSPENRPANATENWLVELELQVGRLAFHELRNPSTGLLHFQRALDLSRGLAEDPIREAVYEHLVEANLALGRRDEARWYLEHIRDGREEAGKAPGNNLAVLLLAAGNLAEADRALARNAVLHPDSAWTMQTMGLVAWLRGETERAGELSRRALELDPEDVDALDVLAKVQFARGDHRKALLDIDRALELRIRENGKKSIEAAWTEATKAEMLLALGRTPEAVAIAAQTARRINQERRLLTQGLPEESALAHLDRYKNPAQDLLLTVAGLPGATTPTVLAAWEEVSRTRRMVFEEMFHRYQWSHLDDAPEVQAVARDFQAARTNLSGLVLRGRGTMPPEVYEATLAEAYERRERAELALADRSARFRKRRVESTISLTDSLQGKFQGLTLLAYVRFNRFAVQGKMEKAEDFSGVPYYGAFVKNAGEDAPRFVVLGPTADLDHAVEAWHAAVLDPRIDYSTAAATLRRRIWDPLSVRTGKSRVVQIIPDGTLVRVNFAALTDESGAYLLEDGFRFSYLTAERDLIEQRSPLTVRHLSLLAMGGPDFDSTSAVGPLRRSSNSITRGPVCEAFSQFEFNPLPGSSAEVREVARMWSHWRAKNGMVLIGSEATESAFKKQAPLHNVLHLATHGFSVAACCGGSRRGSRGIGGLTADGPFPFVAETPTLNSGLALAGANHRTDAKRADGDGILTAAEIGALDLSDVRLAVLSACDSGSGEPVAGDGVVGLQRAFQLAGIQNLVVSLWPVDDHAALEWMKAFYEAWLEKGQPVFAAVHTADLTRLEALRSAGAADHPSKWAAFVAVGPDSSRREDQ